MEAKVPGDSRATLPPPPEGTCPGATGAAAASQLAPQTHPTTTSLPIAEIGVGTTGFGIFFILFGMLLYFDSVLLAFGNLLFLTGLSLIIGLRRTFSFFFQRHKFKGTSFFLGGVVIVLLRWPLLGMCLETYGFFSLFRSRRTDGAKGLTSIPKPMQEAVRTAGNRDPEPTRGKAEIKPLSCERAQDSVSLAH
uniref:Golgi transport 1A n=1 Tax=Bos indicus x Bos taurus TaxID=30522 RepID=A0A4W2FSI8_BOBOX